MEILISIAKYKKKALQKTRDQCRLEMNYRVSSYNCMKQSVPQNRSSYQECLANIVFKINSKLITIELLFLVLGMLKSHQSYHHLHNSCRTLPINLMLCQGKVFTSPADVCLFYFVF